MIGSASIARRRLAPLSVGFTACLAGAAALGWQAGAPVPGRDAATGVSSWSLPPLVAREPARDAAILLARRPWGGSGAFADIDSPRPPPPKTAPWRLAGIVQRGPARLALVLIGEGPAAKLEYRGVGDTLPDGNVLVQIGTDSATSEGGQSAAAVRRVYRLFDKAQ